MSDNQGTQATNRNGVPKPIHFACDIFTTGAVARLAGVAPRTVTKWTDSGRLPSYRIPTGKPHGDRRIHRDDLLAFLHREGFPAWLIERVTGDAVLEVGGTLLGVESVPSLLEAGVALQGRTLRALVLHAGLGRAECLSACRVIRERFPEVRLVVLTSEDDAREADWVGCVVLRQPVDPAALARVVGD